MRTVFAINLNLKPKIEMTGAQVFQDICNRLGRWVEGKYNRAWGAAVTLPQNNATIQPMDNHHIQVQNHVLNGFELLTLEWRHPHDNDPSSSWVTNCTVARNGVHVDFALQLRLAATSTTIRPVGYELGRPKIVTEVLKSYETYIGGWKVPTNVATISAQHVDDFVENTLLTKNRSLPILLISVDPWQDRTLVDPQLLCSDLLGLVHIVVLKDKWASFRLTEAVGKELTCYNGAARIYWPGLTLGANCMQHWLYLPSNLRLREESGVPLGKYLFRVLAGISAFRYTEGPTMTSARKAIAEEERSKLDALKDKVKEGNIEKNELEDQLLKTLFRIDALISEKNRLTEELEREKSNWAEYQNYVCAVEQVDSKSASADTKKPSYTSVAEAYNQAKIDFSEPLLFLESADDSAANSPFKNPERVYELFEALHLVATEWRSKKGILGQSWVEALEKLGFEYKDKISQTSKGKWKDDYEFVYEGQKRLFEQHVTIGAKQADKCLSVHMLRDDEKLVLVIGHCGRHLANTSA